MAEDTRMFFSNNSCVLSHSSVAGQDATEAFFGLHLYEVLQRPQYKRLQVGTIEGEEPQLHGRIDGEVSKVPYAEPSWLVEAYNSPFYKKVRDKLYYLPRSCY